MSRLRDDVLSGGHPTSVRFTDADPEANVIPKLLLLPMLYTCISIYTQYTKYICLIIASIAKKTAINVASGDQIFRMMLL